MFHLVSRAAWADGRRRWLALVVVCLAQLMNALDTTIVNVALPTIQADLDFTQAGLTWVINAYLITFGSCLLLAGRLGDLIGRKRVFLGGVALFTLASVACGLAHDSSLLVAARFIQGIGGAVSSSVIVAIIITEFPIDIDPLARARAMSTYIFVTISGGSLGLLLGGALVQSIDWHWIFFINLPIGIAAMLLGRALIRDNPGLGLAHGVDVLGSLLVTSALMLAIYAIVELPVSGWTAPETLGAAAAALVLGALFVYRQATHDNPIMPLRVLRLGGLVSSSIVRGLAATGLFASFFFSALYLERSLSFGPLQTGLAFLPQTAAVGLLSLGVTARLVQRFGPTTVLRVGLGSFLLGLALLATAGPDAAYYPRLFAAFVFIGLGGGASFMPLLTLALEHVPAEDAGLASGIVNVSMQIAAALGLAILGSAAAYRTQSLIAAGMSPSLAAIDGYQVAYVLAALSVAVGLLATFVLFRARIVPVVDVEAVAEEDWRALDAA
jgi:EmrB/QacA subfamily drug resistance transporter